MPWLRVSILTITILLVTAAGTWYMHGMARRRNAEEPSVAKLRAERNGFQYFYHFVTVWIMIVAPYVDWNFAGDFSPPLVTLFLALVAVVALVYFRRQERMLEDTTNN